MFPVPALQQSRFNQDVLDTKRMPRNSRVSIGTVRATLGATWSTARAWQMGVERRTPCDIHGESGFAWHHVVRRRLRGACLAKLVLKGACLATAAFRWTMGADNGRQRFTTLMLQGARAATITF